MDLSKDPQELLDEEEKKLEEKKEDVETTSEDKEDLQDIHKLFYSLPESPEEKQIEAWKEEHGDVLVSPFSDNEYFVFRPLNRKEWVSLQVQLQQAQTPISNNEVERVVVETCVLWASSKGKTALEKKAGVLSTLHEQILQSSMFVNSAAAANLIIKL